MIVDRSKQGYVFINGSGLVHFKSTHRVDVCMEEDNPKEPTLFQWVGEVRRPDTEVVEDQVDGGVTTYLGSDWTPYDYYFTSYEIYPTLVDVFKHLNKVQAAINDSAQLELDFSVGEAAPKG